MITQHRTRAHDNTPIHSNRFQKTNKNTRTNMDTHTSNRIQYRTHTATASTTSTTTRAVLQQRTTPHRTAPHHTTPHHTHWSILVGPSRCVRRRWVFTRHGRAWTVRKQVSLCSLLADIVNRRSWEGRGDARERKRRDGEEGGRDGEAWCTKQLGVMKVEIMDVGRRMDHQHLGCRKRVDSTI